MKTENLITQNQKSLSSYFENRKEVIFAYLFGSFAKNTNNKLSDVDIAVFVNEANMPDEPDYGYEAEMITDLMGILKLNEIDVVLLNKAGLLLKYQVIRYGKILFCRDEQKKHEFIFCVRQEYLDTQHIRDTSNYYLKKEL